MPIPPMAAAAMAASSSEEKKKKAVKKPSKPDVPPMAAAAMSGSSSTSKTTLKSKISDTAQLLNERKTSPIILDKTALSQVKEGDYQASPTTPVQQLPTISKSINDTLVTIEILKQDNTYYDPLRNAVVYGNNPNNPLYIPATQAKVKELESNVATLRDIREKARSGEVDVRSTPEGFLVTTNADFAYQQAIDKTTKERKANPVLDVTATFLAGFGSIEYSYRLLRGEYSEADKLVSKWQLNLDTKLKSGNAFDVLSVPLSIPAVTNIAIPYGVGNVVGIGTNIATGISPAIGTGTKIITGAGFTALAAPTVISSVQNKNWFALGDLGVGMVSAGAGYGSSQSSGTGYNLGQKMRTATTTSLSRVSSTLPRVNLGYNKLSSNISSFKQVNFEFKQMVSSTKSPRISWTPTQTSYKTPWTGQTGDRFSITSWEQIIGKRHDPFQSRLPPAKWGAYETSWSFYRSSVATEGYYRSFIKPPSIEFSFDAITNKVNINFTSKPSTFPKLETGTIPKWRDAGLVSGRYSKQDSIRIGKMFSKLQDLNIKTGTAYSNPSYSGTSTVTTSLRTSFSPLSQSRYNYLFDDVASYSDSYSSLLPSSITNIMPKAIRTIPILGVSNIRPMSLTSFSSGFVQPQIAIPILRQPIASLGTKKQSQFFNIPTIPKISTSTEYIFRQSQSNRIMQGQFMGTDTISTTIQRLITVSLPSIRTTPVINIPEVIRQNETFFDEPIATSGKSSSTKGKSFYFPGVKLGAGLGSIPGFGGSGPYRWRAHGLGSLLKLPKFPKV